jgi:hypothetical protein
MFDPTTLEKGLAIALLVDDPKHRAAATFFPLRTRGPCRGDPINLLRGRSAARRISPATPFDRRGLPRMRPRKTIGRYGGHVQWEGQDIRREGPHAQTFSTERFKPVDQYQGPAPKLGFRQRESPIPTTRGGEDSVET